MMMRLQSVKVIYNNKDNPNFLYKSIIMNLYLFIIVCTNHHFLCDECVIDACTKCYLNRIPERRVGRD